MTRTDTVRTCVGAGFANPRRAMTLLLDELLTGGDCLNYGCVMALLFDDFLMGGDCLNYGCVRQNYGSVAVQTSDCG